MEKQLGFLQILGDAGAGRGGVCVGNAEEVLIKKKNKTAQDNRLSSQELSHRSPAPHIPTASPVCPAPCPTPETTPSLP